MIVGTAGHIDHGKTALVKALTGVDADRLREERVRGISIDLGYAYMALPDGEILGFVDVPGHEKFISNMLAGATGIDYVLLVVAADDGPMPQTLEHLQILDLLGLDRGAVALTKIDRVTGDRIAAVRGEITRLLADTRLADSPVFPVSAIGGEGIPELCAHLQEAAGRSGRRPVRGGFRLAVDRGFVLTGVGTVVTGSVLSGMVRAGDRMVLSPSGLAVRVRGIHAQNRPAETGFAGQRCALNLAGVEKTEVRRGDWVLSGELHAPTTRVDVRLRLLATEEKALQHWAPVQVHHGAGHTSGRLALLCSNALHPGTEGLAQLVLDQPVCAVHGDRMILRDGSGRHTRAGAFVLDASPPARGRRTARRLAALAAWSRHTPADILAALLDVSRAGVDLMAFSRNLNLDDRERDTLLSTVASRRTQTSAPRLFSVPLWFSVRETSVRMLEDEHRDSPDTSGLNLEQLRLRAAPALDRRSYGELVAELVAERLVDRDGSWLHLPGHEVALGASDEKQWAAIAPLLTAEPFRPPRVRDIAKLLQCEEAAVRRLLMLVARIGRIYRVARDHYFDRRAVTELAEIAKHIAAESPAGAVRAAEFRNRIGVGRKLAIQILEFFDRIGLTRRVRDEHRLRNDRLLF